MKVVIIEDEELAASKLERQLHKIDDNINVIAKLESVADAIVWFKSNSCDLIFLDIHLSDGVSFKIFESVKVKTPIIFTTAYDQYAIQAFKLNSLDYLLKPISKKDLANALDKYQEQASIASNLPNIDMSSLIEAMEGSQQEYKERFLIKRGDHIQTISISDVAYFFAEGKYSFLIDKKGEEHLIDLTLEKLTNLLNPKQFFRINRQFIVGIDSIKEMYAWTKSRVKLELNPTAKQETIVSVERSPEFKKWLDK